MDLLLYGAVAIGFISIVVFVIISLFHKRKPRNQHADAYIQGLNALIDGDKQSALEHLKLAALQRPDNVVAYLRIGDILRESGKFLGAIKIHKQLDVRNGLNKTEKVQINQALINDYLAAGNYEKALESALKLQTLDKRDLWTLEKLLECYENLNQWENAFILKQKIIKLTGEKDPKVLALFKVRQTAVYLEEDQEKEARACFKETLKQDEKCAPAYIQFAEYYIKNGRQGEALKLLKKFILKVPNYAYLAFDRIQELLFETGHFREIETIFLEAHQKYPDNKNTTLALAHIYEKKGHLDDAIELYNQIIEKYPKAFPVWYALVRAYDHDQRYETGLKLVMKWLKQAMSEQKEYVCNNCRYQSHEPFWQCPDCKSWDSMTHVL